MPFIYYMKQLFRRLLMVVMMMCSVTAAADLNDLSPESLRVRDAYVAWTAAPDDAAAQDAFLAAFPGTTQAFLQVFMSPDFGQLYDGAEEIAALRAIGASRPRAVLTLGLNISTGLAWDADAVAYLQDLIHLLGAKHPDAFIDALQAFTPEQQGNAIRFLADGVHGASPHYLALMRAVADLGEAELAARMQDAVPPDSHHH